MAQCLIQRLVKFGGKKGNKKKGKEEQVYYGDLDGKNI